MMKILPKRSRRGMSGLELALSMPLMLGFILAIVDLGRYVTDLSRATAAAAAVADLVAQGESFVDKTNPDQVVNGNELGVVNIAAREVAAPLELFEKGAVIITVINNTGGGPTVVWKRRWGRTDIVSQAGPTNMRGIVLQTNEAVVYAEVGYRFIPYLLSEELLGLEDESNFMTIAVRRPRLTGPTLVPAT